MSGCNDFALHELALTYARIKKRDPQLAEDIEYDMRVDREQDNQS